MPDRILRESICRSDTINNLSYEEEVFFYRLMVHCDDFGRFDAKPALLRSALYPLRTDDIPLETIIKWRDAIADKELIQVYQVSGKEYIQVITWSKYQRRRADHSKYPEPVNIIRPLTTSAVKGQQAHANASVFEYDNDNENRNSINDNDNENDNGDDSSGSSINNKKQDLSSEDIAEITTRFEEVICKVTSGIAEELNKAFREYAKKELLEAIRACENQNKHTMVYFMGCLKNIKNGVDSSSKDKFKTAPDKFIKGKYGHMVQR